MTVKMVKLRLRANILTKKSHKVGIERAGMRIYLRKASRPVEIRRTCRTIGHFFKMSDKKRPSAGPNVRQKFSDREKNVSRSVNEITRNPPKMAAAWPISWQNKNKRKADSGVEQTQNKAKYEANRTERSFQHGWKSGRPWLAFEDGQMKCTHCVTFVEQCRSKENYENLKNRNKFLTGCTNFRSTTITDHERSKMHLDAVSFHSKSDKAEDLLRETCYWSLYKANMANAITIPVKDTNVTKGTGFGEYFNNESFSDVKISVGNREFQAHKIILSAKSEVFKTMLSMVWLSENQSEIDLQETVQAEEVFGDFLGYLYSGDLVKLTEDNVIPLLMLADKYLVGDMAKVIIDHMLKNVGFDNAVPWYRFALEFKIECLYQTCIIFISHNFEHFTDKGKFDMLECKEFALLLDSGALVVKSEMVVVEAIQKWLRACGRLMYEEVEKDFVTLFNCVRIPMLSPVELHAVEKMSEFKDLIPAILPNLLLGYKFHTATLDLTKFETSEKLRIQKYLTPRIYYQRCGSTLPKSELMQHTFQTPAVMSNSKNIKSVWLYSIRQPNALSVLHCQALQSQPTQPMIRVRTVVFIRKPRDGVDEVKILVDLDHHVAQGKNELHFGMAALDLHMSHIKEKGMVITALPYPIDFLSIK